MDALGTLRQEKTELLEKISTAAKEGKSEIVLSASEKLRKVEILINRCEQLEVEIADLQREGGLQMNTETANQNRMKPISHPIPRTSVKSVRENGREIREAFLKRLLQAGVSLQQVRGETIYKTKSGEKVGIAVATERQPDRWFLGLPEGGFDHAVLLCQREGGDIIELRLPKGFFAKYGSALSESKGQVKFNISRKGNVYSIKVPGTDGVNPTTFSSDYSFLK
jgi:hypothetical protein